MINRTLVWKKLRQVTAGAFKSLSFFCFLSPGLANFPVESAEIDIELLISEVAIRVAVSSIRYPLLTTAITTWYQRWQVLFSKWRLSIDLFLQKTFTTRMPVSPVVGG